MNIKFLKKSLKLKNFLTKVKESFQVDLRSLAIFRMGLALLILADLINRAGNITAHYTDLGVVPRSFIMYTNRFWYLSLHMLSGDKFYQILLFSISGIFAIALFLGYRTRLVTFVSWYLFASLNIRNPYILQGGESMLTLMLFWSLFMPLGAYYSIDSGTNSSKIRAKNFLSYGITAYFIQIIVVYLFTAIFKLSYIEWLEGTAVYNALSTDHYVKPLGKILLSFPLILKFLTYYVLFFELIGPFLLLISFKTGVFRTIMVFAFFFLQIGFGGAMELGTFPWIMSIAMIPFLPTLFWDSILSKIWFYKIQSIVNDKSKILKSNFKKILGSGRIILKLPKITNFIVLLFLIYVVLWNLHTVRVLPMSDRLKTIGYVFQLNQEWSMFAQSADPHDGWFVVKGVLKDGAEFDPWKNKPVSWEKPALVSADYKDQYWQNFMVESMGYYWWMNYTQLTTHFGQYLCNDWNKNHQEEEMLKELEIFFILDSDSQNCSYKPNKILMLKHSCF